ncbi:MAG TPA: hypothetical protein VMU92_07210 [Acidobacteriaceae bacterium]|nr:hypothetical protein [Acidobacteriaceae bacterium]
MRWLSSLRNFLRVNGEKTEAQKSEGYELEPHDLVSRFIYSSRAFSAQHGFAKPGAFNPEPYSKLSVFHSTGLSDKEIWGNGRKTLSAQRGRDKIYCRADLSVAIFISHLLKVIRDDDPFERHTSVVGWPNNANPDQRKADVKAICLELSQDPEVKLVIPQKPITKDDSEPLA